MKTIKPDKKKALFHAKRQLVELVYDAVNLEGINYTLPEVQTLLEGVTVGGHKLTDQTITLNQANAWGFLFDAVKNNHFELSKTFACQLHAIAAIDEALEWGCFRKSPVSISGTNYTPPPPETLDTHWNELIETTHKINDIYDQAIHIFLQMARHQSFYDVNKRMGRFMMNGFLLNAGYPAINLPAKRQLEFNTLMLDFYPSNDERPMNTFMKSCLSNTIINAMS